MIRTRLIVVLAALVAAGLPAFAMTATPPPAAASPPTSPYALVSVSGSPLGNVTASSPYALSPTFSPSTTDYVLHCNTGTNRVILTLSGSAGPVSVDTNQQSSPNSGASVNVTLNVVPNQAIVLYSPDPSNPGDPNQYWIRCLPPDFPALQVTTAGGSSPGWNPGYYFTGTVPFAQQTSYAMVLDGNGTPVWYQQLAANLGGALNVQPLPNDTIAWSPSLGPGIGAGDNGNAYTGFDLATQNTIAPLPAAVSPTDEHELWPLPNGDRLMISTPVITGVDLSTLGDGTLTFGGTTPSSAADGNVVDCVVQEVNPSNQAVWSWDASQHIGLDEVNTVGNSGPSWILDTINGNPAADIYHCNSVSMDEDASSPFYGDVLVSMRHLNAVFLIDPTTGDVVWKMGGTPLTSGEPEEEQGTPAEYLAIMGDSEGGICGQHDARFVATPNPAVEDVSVYDDHSACPGARAGSNSPSTPPPAPPLPITSTCSPKGSRCRPRAAFAGCPTPAMTSARAPA